MNTPPLDVTVEVRLDVVAKSQIPEGRRRILVLRRLVRTDGGAMVDEIRLGECGRTRADLLQCVESLSSGLPELFRGRNPGPCFPLRHADLAALNELEYAQVGGQVERLVDVHGTVRDVAGEAILDRVDVATSPSTAAGRAVERLVVRVFGELQLLPYVPPHDDAARVSDGSRDSGPGVAGTADCSLNDLIGGFRRRLQAMDRVDDAVLACELVPGNRGELSDEHAATLLTWRRPESLDLLSGTGIPEATRVVLSFVEVDGLQIGRGNRQTNVFTYRITPHIDLEEVLRHPMVQSAMTAYATATPEEIVKCRQAAVRALHDAGQSQPSSMPELPSPERMTAPTTEVIEQLGRTVVIQDCRGVQIGDRAKQVNEFAYTISPTVEAADLLHTSPELVNALVDDVCRSEASGQHTVHELLRAAVGARAREAYERAPGSGVIRAPQDHLAQARGITYGPGARQQDRISVAVNLSRAVDRFIDIERVQAKRLREQAATMACGAEVPKHEEVAKSPARRGRVPSGEVQHARSEIEDPMVQGRSSGLDIGM